MAFFGASGRIWPPVRPSGHNGMVSLARRKGREGKRGDAQQFPLVGNSILRLGRGLSLSSKVFKAAEDSALDRVIAGGHGPPFLNDFDQAKVGRGLRLTCWGFRAPLWPTSMDKNVCRE